MPGARGRCSLTQAAPDLAIVRIQLQYVLQVLDGFGEILLGSEYAGDGIHRLNGLEIMSQSLVIGKQRAIEVVHMFGATP